MFNVMYVNNSYIIPIAVSTIFVVEHVKYCINIVTKS